MVENQDARELDARRAGDYAAWIGHVVRVRARSMVGPDTVQAGRLLATQDVPGWGLFVLEGVPGINFAHTEPSTDGSPVTAQATIQRVRVDP